MSENLGTSGSHRRPCGRSVDAVWRVGCLSDTVSGMVSLPAGSASVDASTPTARRGAAPPTPESLRDEPHDRPPTFTHKTLSRCRAAPDIKASAISGIETQTEAAPIGKCEIFWTQPQPGRWTRGQGRLTPRIHARASAVPHAADLLHAIRPTGGDRLGAARDSCLASRLPSSRYWHHAALIARLEYVDSEPPAMSATRADRTAIRRTSLSRPVALAVGDTLIRHDRTFFDYGCGRGGDLGRLHKMGISVAGWDPAFFPAEERMPADVVNLGYVINVIEDPDERAVVLSAAWSLARTVLIVSARLDWEATDTAVNFHGDGVITSKRTFQKFFTQEELRQWIERVLDRHPIAAAPGIFYVFRDDADEQSFAVNRVARRRQVPGIEQCQELVADHHELIEPLMTFITQRGRLPVDGELPTASQLMRSFGSVARAFSWSVE